MSDTERPNPEPSDEVKESYYILPSGKRIPIDPEHPEEAAAQLPGEIIGDFAIDPANPPPGIFQEKLVRDIYYDRYPEIAAIIDRESPENREKNKDLPPWFKDPQIRATLERFRDDHIDYSQPISYSGFAYMDPSGIMSPASVAPQQVPKGRITWYDVDGKRHPADLSEMGARHQRHHRSHPHAPRN